MPYKTRFCSLALLLCTLLPLCTAQAAQSPGQQRNALRQKQLQERAVFDQCMEATVALVEPDQEQAQRQCRRTYALLRLTSPEALWDAFDKKIIAAQEEYVDRLLAVRGPVHKAGIASLGYPEIVFGLDAFGVRSVRCQFPKAAAKDVQALRPGDTVTLGGICKGFANENVVRLINCELL